MNLFSSFVTKMGKLKYGFPQKKRQTNNNDALSRLEPENDFKMSSSCLSHASADYPDALNKMLPQPTLGVSIEQTFRFTTFHLPKFLNVTVKMILERQMKCNLRVNENLFIHIFLFLPHTQNMQSKCNKQGISLTKTKENTLMKESQVLLYSYLK